MIADAKLTGTSKDGISVARYMLNPDAKSCSPIIRELHNSQQTERVLKIETDHAFPAIMFLDPEEAARRFISDVEKWTKNHRPGKVPPKSIWEHRVIAFHPSDSNKVSPALACKIARKSLKEIASGDRPTLYVVHGDKQHMHVHLLYATVNHKGVVHNLHQDYRAWERLMEKMEIKYGLYRVEKRIACSKDDQNRQPDGTNPSKREFRMIDRTGSPSSKQQLKSKLDSILQKCESAPIHSRLTTFIRGLQRENIDISVHTQSSGRMLGIRLHFGIFQKTGIKSSDLGRAYSWNVLSERIGFTAGNTSQLKYLKSCDHRIPQWIKSQSGGKAWANCVSSKKPDALSRNTGLFSTSSYSMTTPGESGGVIPDFYPPWLRRYIRSLIAEANAELRRIKAKQDAIFQQCLKSISEILINTYKVRLASTLKEVEESAQEAGLDWEAFTKN